MALEISLSKSTGKSGDLITITATTGNFLTPYNKNVVTFNGIIADILEGTSTTLLVTVPITATSGLVLVETFTDSDTEDFTVVYSDKLFKQSDPAIFKKGSINGKIKTLGIGSDRAAIYNRDLSYSNFNEVIDENSLLQNLYTIILTEKGERIFEPEFGTTINSLLFELINSPEDTEQKILEEVINAVNTYEPRVTIIEEQSFLSVNAEKNDISLILTVSLPNGNVQELGITLKNIKNETHR